MDTIICGDCLEELPKLPDQIIDSVITSPPYAQQRKDQYGGISVQEYPAWTVKWLEAIKPKLKPGGSVAIVIRPHIENGVVSDYVLRTRLAVRDAGWFETDEMIWIKPNSPPIGNNKRPRRAWESILWFSLDRQPYCDPKANGHVSDRVGMKGKKGKKEGYVQGITPSEEWQPTVGVARCRDYVEVGTAEVDYSPQNTHPVQFPVRLASWLVTLLCPPEGVVLDPFLGSGSTALACIKEKRKYIGIEISSAYCDIAKNRIATCNYTSFC